MLSENQMKEVLKETRERVQLMYQDWNTDKFSPAHAYPYVFYGVLQDKIKKCKLQ